MGGDTVHRADWDKKIDSYAQAVKGDYYQEAFGTPSLTIAFVTTGGERRLRELLAWTATRLKSTDETGLAPYLLFAAFDPASLYPEQVFLAPMWNIPLSYEQQPLLERAVFE
jgi:hypothetical protein